MFAMDEDERRQADYSAARERYNTTTELIADAVRRLINRNRERPDVKEDLAHLVQGIRRRICGMVSSGLPSFSVLSFLVILKLIARARD